MQSCVERGFHAQGMLPGVLKVRRRAPKLFRQLTEASTPSPMVAMDWVNAFALAVNEENAAGGRVVTAPTNGAAGIIPAVLSYYRRFESGSSDNGVLRFLLVGGAVGMLYKMNASISGAEMGCQGEVGVACSMAAAGLVAAVSLGEFGAASMLSRSGTETMPVMIARLLARTGDLVRTQAFVLSTLLVVTCIAALLLVESGARNDTQPRNNNRD